MEEFEEFHLHKVKHIKKIGIRKETSDAFQTTLINSLPEVYETRLKNLNEKKTAKLMWKVERPKSASFLSDLFYPKSDSKKLIKSSEFSQQPTFLEKARQNSGERENQKKQFEHKKAYNCSCWKKHDYEWTSLLGLDLMSSSGCGSDTLKTGQDESWTRFKPSSRLQIKPRSNPTTSKTILNKIFFDREKEFHKVKRSLRLLGFELSDFGIRSAWMKDTLSKKPVEKSATLTTKITNRSVSLDSLRATVKRAWMEDRLDESHRRLLAQAAYEEWYFRKESELFIKRNKEKLSRLKAQENMREDFEKKKEKSENEFRKWLQRKRIKRRKKTLMKSTFDKETKSKEESEKAFREWIKKKQEELERVKKEKKKEEERRLESETEKNDKKKKAEKVFQLWKTKLNETKIQEERKRLNQKKKQEFQERGKKNKGLYISFEKWKTVKDQQMRERIKQNRLTCRAAREKRREQMEERMYESEQAFEDWLEKVDTRKQRQCSTVNTYNKIIPWIPA